MHFWKNFFTTHPYKFPVIGEKQLFIALKRDDLVNYYKKMYVPNNMILVVCGDINKDEIKEKVIEKTCNLNPSPLSPVILPQEPPQLAQKRVHIRKRC